MGAPINLIANCFSVHVPSGNIYHYDVDILIRKYGAEQSEAPYFHTLPTQHETWIRNIGRKRRREIINTMVSAYDIHFKECFPAYDGAKNLYTRKLLKNAPFSLNVKIEDDGMRMRRESFLVVIKPVIKKENWSCAINLDSFHTLFNGQTSTVPQEAIMALQTILQQSPCLRYISIKRHFFYPSNKNLSVGSGKEIWFGYHQSLRLGQWKPLLNIDVSATTFYKKEPVINFVCKLLNTTAEVLHQTPRLREAEIVILNKELNYLWITTTLLNRPNKYRIIKVITEPAKRLEFSKFNITVEQYFSQKYNINLEFAHLPCLQVASASRNVYLPIEICELLENQHCKKKFSEGQTREMIQFTSLSPKDRFNEINTIIRDVEFDKDKYLKEFDLKVNLKPMAVEGTVIEAPAVRYYKDALVKPREGSWDMRNKKFFEGAKINKWVLISFANPRSCNRNILEKFVDMLQKIGCECGININRPIYMKIFDTYNYDVNAILKNVKERHEADLAIIVLPKTPKIYGEIKQVAETILGLATQCVRDRNVSKCNTSLIVNLCQKINAKLGGVNSSLALGGTLEILEKPAIIIGIYVRYSGQTPFERNLFSVAAVVGSLDAHPSRYAVACRPQRHANRRKNINVVLDLKSMVVEILRAFYTNTKGKKPEKIIAYRSGVSDGQFSTVQDFEVKKIREACKSLSNDYEPGITFIVVQRTHHVRFRPVNTRAVVDHVKNVPPGTTVDKDITDPLSFNFLLCSHFSVQGTSRPSHYTVLEDDNDFNADDLQKLTYYLCHSYVRCTKSISVPSPVAYADLAARRARQYLLTYIDESSVDSDSSITAFTSQQVTDYIKIVGGLKNTMYFV